MKPEFIVESRGKKFVLYAGLLDMAHAHGLRSIRTELVQAPTELNNRTAICTATVTLAKDGEERLFTGIGDAAPNSVAPAMQTCLIRMAETRAKARALRDAVNISVAAFEELGDEQADQAPHQPRARAASEERTAPTSPKAASSKAPSLAKAQPSESGKGLGLVPEPIPADLRNPSVNPITEAQTQAIQTLCRRLAIDPNQYAAERFERNLGALTQSQAGELIRALGASQRRVADESSRLQPAASRAPSLRRRSRANQGRGWG